MADAPSRVLVVCTGAGVVAPTAALLSYWFGVMDGLLKWSSACIGLGDARCVDATVQRSVQRAVLGLLTAFRGRVHHARKLL